MRPRVRPALRFDAGADVGARAFERRFAPDPALDDVSPADLELRLDEAHEPRRLGGEFQHMRQHQPLRNEADVDGDRRRRLAETLRVKGARIEAFEPTHALIQRKTRIELSMADVDRNDLRRATLAARRR